MWTHPCNCSLPGLAWSSTRLAHGQPIVHSPSPRTVQQTCLVPWGALPGCTPHQNGNPRDNGRRAARKCRCLRDCSEPTSSSPSPNRCPFNVITQSHMTRPRNLQVKRFPKLCQETQIEAWPHSQPGSSPSYLTNCSNCTSFISFFFPCPQRRWETAGHHPSSHNYLFQIRGQSSCSLAFSFSA